MLFHIVLHLFLFQHGAAFQSPTPGSRFTSSRTSYIVYATASRNEAQRHQHSEVISPPLPNESLSSEPNESHEQTPPLEEDLLSRLMVSLQASPTDLLRLHHCADGIRGVYLNHHVGEGEKILSVPLSSCLVDHNPPQWLEENEHTDKPSSWIARLAATLVDMHLRAYVGDLEDGHALWLSLLPEKERLRASLPVHWEEATVQNARCGALELAVDSAYFARGEAVHDIMGSLQNIPSLTEGWDDMELRALCSSALDLVQTRARPFLQQSEQLRSFWGPTHAVVPVFDFINHGSSCRGKSCANAYFGLEADDKGGNQRVVVRARWDLDSDEEVLIDYGDLASPAWKCLLSYGFVPKFKAIPDSGEDPVDDFAGDDDGNVAEVYLDGIRYEVGPSSIPTDMVLVASSDLSSKPTDEPVFDPEDLLTSEVALRIARRISDVAYHLLLEPEQDMYDDHPAATPTPFQVISYKLASSLRWTQHRILLSCAQGLREYALHEESFL